MRYPLILPMPSISYNFFLSAFLCLGLALTSTAQITVERVKRLTNVIDSYPMPSPDGKKVAFQSNRTGDWEIFVIDMDGSNIRQLTHSKGFDGGPIWSPDGTK